MTNLQRAIDAHCAAEPYLPRDHVEKLVTAFRKARAQTLRSIRQSKRDHGFDPRTVPYKGVHGLASHDPWYLSRDER